MSRTLHAIVAFDSDLRKAKQSLAYATGRTVGRNTALRDEPQDGRRLTVLPRNPTQAHIFWFAYTLGYYEGTPS
ncbi:MAG: hypothetical protein OXL41_03910 [Nitrospinae bacterium]|nr:hypothetical protein [Nitrospinota bacterium]